MLFADYAAFKSKITKMIRLNLPTFEIKLSGTKEHPRIFDILRRRYVALTPEEWVRQHLSISLQDTRAILLPLWPTRSD